MEKSLLNVHDIADYLGVQPVTIYRWCREGRLPCIKIGKEWRVRREALDSFLQRGERGGTLVGRLRGFFEMPDHVIAVAESEELLHRLDAAFFQVGEAQGALLVKFTAEGIALDALRAALERHGLAVASLEAAGRLRFVSETDPLGGRAAALRALLAETAAAGRPLWVCFDWTADVGLERALRQQQALEEIVGASQAVVKTGVLERVVDGWPPPIGRRAEALHRGAIGLSATRLSLSRAAPLPPA